MKTTLAIILLISLLAVNKARPDDMTNGLSGRWAVAYGTSMANVSRMALTALYEGKTNETIQILEANLDHAVCHIDELLSKVTNHNHTVILKSMLTSIAEFRSIHERPKVTIFGSKEDLELMDGAAQKAKQILERYRRVKNE